MILKTIEPSVNPTTRAQIKQFLTQGAPTLWQGHSTAANKKFLPLLDFVGHLETAAQDAKELLERIGAWDEYGKSGWGKYGNESIFQSNNVLHKTADDSSASSARLSKYYTPESEARVEE
jgi:hypothetical protein